MTDTDKEKIKTEREFYFKINAMRYDFAKQRYIALMPILVAAFGFIAFAIDKLNILHILKTSMNPGFEGLVVTIVGFFVTIFSFFKSKYSVVVGVFLVMVAVVVSGRLIFVESVAVIIIASLFCLYAVFACLALHTTYSCLLDLEKYLECQAETKDYEIRKLQGNTNEKGEDIEKKRQECENNEKKAREDYEEGKGKLSYCLLVVMISVMVCVLCSVIYNTNVWEHKVAKKMASDQNSSMECFCLTIENPKPKEHSSGFAPSARLKNP